MFILTRHSGQRRSREAEATAAAQEFGELAHFIRETPRQLILVDLRERNVFEHDLRRVASIGRPDVQDTFSLIAVKVPNSISFKRALKNGGEPSGIRQIEPAALIVGPS